ncbi:MAG: OmpA/MotB family protein [Bacillota bacterium]
MARHTRNDDAPRSQPWLNSYADMVTLLMTFFIMLYSMSILDAAKFKAITESYSRATGVMLDGGASVLPGDGGQSALPDPAAAVAAMELEQLRATGEQFARELEATGFAGKVSVEMDERGLILRFADSVLFDLGSADIRPEAAAALTQVGAMIKDLENPIRVEGHTDDWPIATERFPSNWELSTGRAGSVVRFFIEKSGIDETKLQVAGYAEFRPIDTNETAKGRQRNRRVDVVILRPSLAGGEPPIQ